jgi:hypothetical protein
MCKPLLLLHLLIGRLVCVARKHVQAPLFCALTSRPFSMRWLWTWSICTECEPEAFTLVANLKHSHWLWTWSIHTDFELEAFTLIVNLKHSHWLWTWSICTECELEAFTLAVPGSTSFQCFGYNFNEPWCACVLVQVNASLGLPACV